VEFDANGEPVVDQFSEDGFVDLVFRVHDLSTTENSYRFLMLASYQGQKVGARVRLRRGIGPGLDSNVNLIPDHVYRRGIAIERSGPESDRLITTIAQLYGMPDGPRQMVESETYTVIALHQADIQMDVEAVSMKIFGNDSEPISEDDYYECFFNTDFPAGFVYWNEKDPDYRVPLLRALTNRVDSSRES
jgi:hypothetical protein